MSLAEVGPQRLAEFAGRWRLERRIDDHLGGTTGHLTGQAWFRPHQGGLRYEEEGQLRMGSAKPIRARRVYLWQPAPGSADAVAVLFEDGTPFHDFNITAQTPAAHHNCPPDSYDVRYDFAAWPDWQARWTVRGPRKNYTMVTHHSRD